MPLGCTSLELDSQMLSSLWHLCLYSEPFPVTRPACQVALVQTQHPSSTCLPYQIWPPSDFFLFLEPKDYPKGDKISGFWEDTVECTQQLQAISKQAYHRCIENWKDHCNRCALCDHPAANEAAQ